ncbi:MAG: M15 family metallopeptidase [Thermoanaerobaculia bacterium]
MARQQWLYAQGRTRPGARVTNRDGVVRPSDHQSRCAADCYPAKDGRVIWPPPPDADPRWRRYAEIAEANGLVAGFRWKDPHDPPHVELRKEKH